MRLHKCTRGLQGWVRIYIVIQLVVTVTMIFLLYSKTSIQQPYQLKNLIQNGDDHFHTDPEPRTVSDKDVSIYNTYSNTPSTMPTRCKCQPGANAKIKVLNSIKKNWKMHTTKQLSQTRNTLSSHLSLLQCSPHPQPLFNVTVPETHGWRSSQIRQK